METGKLPKAREGPRSATVDNIIFLIGGMDDDSNVHTSILSWDPSTESWQPAGGLSVGREWHAAVAVSSSILESECSALLSI